jgi:hypothetical protein
MKVYADRKPLVSEVTGWTRIYHNGDVQVYEAENYHDFYKVITATSRPKFFFGETAWMDCQRYAVDKSDFSAYTIFS